MRDMRTLRNFKPNNFRRLLAVTLVAAFALPASAEVPQLKMSLTDEGVKCDCGSMGAFTLGYPSLQMNESASRGKTSVSVNGSTAAVTYDGSTITVTLGSDGTVTFTRSGRPAGYNQCRFEFYVPMSFNDGGSWTVGGASGAFPLAYGSEKLSTGQAGGFSITSPDGAKLAFTDFSRSVYIELQDNRAYGWSVFQANFYTLGGGEGWDVLSWSFKVSLDTSGYVSKYLVDEFGQVERDFPGKITSVDDLKADARTESDYYAALDFPGRLAAKGMTLDRFGGIAGVGARLGLKGTGFFRTARVTVGGRTRWLMLDPLGNPFFHMGVCCFALGDDSTEVAGREDRFTWLPEKTDATYDAAWQDAPGTWWHTRAFSFYRANVIRKYGSFDMNTHVTRAIGRVRQIGFNSIGAFTSAQPSAAAADFPTVLMLDVGSPRALGQVRGMFDPFDAESVSAVENALKGVAAAKDDPLVIGYFLANEQAFEDVPEAVPALDASYAAKQKFVDYLRERYGSIGAFNSAWGVSAASFDALAGTALKVNTDAARADAEAFAGRLADAYYDLVCTTFRKYDGNHLLLGSRWQPKTADREWLCRAAGRHLDVVSVNYYTAAPDPEFVGRVYEWSGGRPQMWSEFFYTSTTESNCASFGYDFPTQRERGEAYSNYLHVATSLDCVTGIEWFTLVDQAATGRYFEGPSGERSNSGIFNVADRPYADLVTSMLGAHLETYGRLLGSDATSAAEEVPQLTLSLTEDGVMCDCGSMGAFTFKYPSLQMNGSGDRQKKSVAVNGSTATVIYDDMTVTVTLGSDGTVTFTRSEYFAGYNQCRFEFYLPLEFYTGGAWTMGGSSGAFPFAYGSEKLFTGFTGGFSITSPEGARLAFTDFTGSVWAELQDDRTWDVSAFQANFFTMGGGKDWDVLSWSFKVSLDTSGCVSGYLVDESGKVVRDFPGTVSSVVRSGASGSSGAQASVTAAPPRTGAYYTVFTSTDLLGVFRAETSSQTAFSGSELPTLTFSADAPVKFARIVISSEPYESGAVFPYGPRE